MGEEPRQLPHHHDSAGQDGRVGVAQLLHQHHHQQDGREAGHRAKHGVNRHQVRVFQVVGEIVQQRAPHQRAVHAVHQVAQRHQQGDLVVAQRSSDLPQGDLRRILLLHLRFLLIAGRSGPADQEASRKRNAVNNGHCGKSELEILAADGRRHGQSDRRHHEICKDGGDGLKLPQLCPLHLIGAQPRHHGKERDGHRRLGHPLQDVRDRHPNDLDGPPQVRHKVAQRHADPRGDGKELQKIAAFPALVLLFIHKGPHDGVIEGVPKPGDQNDDGRGPGGDANDIGVEIQQKHRVEQQQQHIAQMSDAVAHLYPQGESVLFVHVFSPSCSLCRFGSAMI